MELPPDHTYAIRGPYAYAKLCVPFIALLGIPYLAYAAVEDAHSGASVVAIGLVLWSAHGGLRWTYRIDLRGDIATFKTLRTTTSTRIADIQRLQSSGVAGFTVVSSGRKLRALGPMNDIGDLVARVRAANPAVRISGL